MVREERECYGFNVYLYLQHIKYLSHEPTSLSLGESIEKDGQDAPIFGTFFIS